jgi:MGT family glycosyltransferase
MKDLRTDLPWVHITEGTFHVREPFLLRAAAQGLANLPMEVIMTTADSRTADDLKIGPPAQNIHVVDWVNHGDLLPKTSVMVTTAGGGTTMAGMGAGVPLAVVPTEWDKAENAQRVVEAGAGIRLSPGQCTPQRLRETVQEILGDPSFTANARRIAAGLKRQGGPERAAHLLEEITGRKQNVRSNEPDNAAARCA